MLAKLRMLQLVVISYEIEITISRFSCALFFFLFFFFLFCFVLFMVIHNRCNIMSRAVQRVKDPPKLTEIDQPVAQQVDLKPMVSRIWVLLSQKLNIRFG